MRRLLLIGTGLAGILVAALLAGVLGALVANGAFRGGSPGVFRRLRLALTTNVAETSGTALLPELRPPRFQEDPDAVLAAALGAVEDLGWRVAAADPQARTLHAVISSGLWGFRDDLHLTVLAPGGHDAVTLKIRSTSRLGRGDLGANARHVRDLRNRIQERLHPGG